MEISVLLSTIMMYTLPMSNDVRFMIQTDEMEKIINEFIRKDVGINVSSHIVTIMNMGAILVGINIVSGENHEVDTHAATDALRRRYFSEASDTGKGLDVLVNKIFKSDGIKTHVFIEGVSANGDLLVFGIDDELNA